MCVYVFTTAPLIIIIITQNTHTKHTTKMEGRKARASSGSMPVGSLCLRCCCCSAPSLSPFRSSSSPLCLSRRYLNVHQKEFFCLSLCRQPFVLFFSSSQHTPGGLKRKHTKILHFVFFSFLFYLSIYLSQILQNLRKSRTERTRGRRAGSSDPAGKTTNTSKNSLIIKVKRSFVNKQKQTKKRARHTHVMVMMNEKETTTTSTKQSSRRIFLFFLFVLYIYSQHTMLIVTSLP